MAALALHPTPKVAISMIHKTCTQGTNERLSGLCKHCKWLIRKETTQNQHGNSYQFFLIVHTPLWNQLCVTTNSTVRFVALLWWSLNKTPPIFIFRRNLSWNSPRASVKAKASMINVLDWLFSTFYLMENTTTKCQLGASGMPLLCQALHLKNNVQLGVQRKVPSKFLCIDTK
jgi:hypothetical protein